MVPEKKYINVPSLGVLADYQLKDIVIAIGVFDGVHLGHQHVLKKLSKMADAYNAQPVALTFFPHPKQVLVPDAVPVLLVSPEQKVELLYQNGVKAVVTIPFTKEFSSLSPEDFIKICLSSSRVTIHGICVGEKWRFGSGAKGTVQLLKDFADKGHFQFESVPEVYLDNTLISSTTIRRAVSSGIMNEAQKMLGRPYSLIGKVITGRKIAGSALTFPTANLKINYGVVPPNGVYAGFSTFKGRKYPAAIAIGTAPTFRHNFVTREPKIEVHMFDFSESIYDETLEVTFISYLREERCYSSVDSLKHQIHEDILDIKQLLKNSGFDPHPN